MVATGGQFLTTDLIEAPVMNNLHPLTIAATGIALVTTVTVAAVPSAALACNPDDCSGLSSEELARDRAEIRRLNREQLRYVQRRDAGYSRGWDAQREHSKTMSAYERERAEYERRMAQWREAVRRCNAGDLRYCAG